MSSIITIKHRGNFSKSYKFLKNVINLDYKAILDRYGIKGVEALSANTPFDTGNTANSWSYSIEENRSSISIVWSNENLNDGVNIAIILQYGHGTGTGGYVEGRDYINPALRPVFDEMANTIWKELIRR